jgi:hypothetical protein
VHIGLINCSRKYSGSGEDGYAVYTNYYTAPKELKIDDADYNKFAFIHESDMLMLDSKARYIIGAILNKFHYMAVEQGFEGSRLSCGDILGLLSVKASAESIRLYLNILEQLGLIAILKRQQGASYELKFTDKLKSYELQKIILESAKEVLKVFVAYRKAYFGEETTSSTRKSWLQTIMNVLEPNGGREYRQRKQLILRMIAFLCRKENERMRLIVRSPSHLKNHWDEIASGALGVSKRWTMKFISRLVNGGIKSGYEKEKESKESIYLNKDKITPPKGLTIFQGDILQGWYESLDKVSLRLKFSCQSHGVNDRSKEDVITFEDYLCQAKVLMARYLLKHGSIEDMEQANKWLYWKLKDYMFKNRRIDRTPGGDKKILRVSVVDFEHFLETVDIPAVESIECAEDYKLELSDEVKAALGCLSRREKIMIKLYFGFYGRVYTQDEIAKRCRKSKSWINYSIQRSIKRLRNVLDPPT